MIKEMQIQLEKNENILKNMTMKYSDEGNISVYIVYMCLEFTIIHNFVDINKKSPEGK